MDEIKTLGNLLNSLKQLYKEQPVIKYRNRKGEWKGLKAEVIIKEVYELAKGIYTLGLRKGDKIALMAHTTYEWTIIDFAIQILGIVNVPIYPTLTGEQIKYIVEDSECKLFIAYDENLMSKIWHHRNELNIKNYVLIQSTEGKKSKLSGNKENLLVLDDLKEKGKSSKIDDNTIKKIANSINGDDLATILYTSGTTGVPKGVKLSHRNLVTNADDAVDKLNLSIYDDTLVFLPLSHAFSRTCNYALMMAYVTLWYAESIDTLGRDMIEAKPQVLIVVPRVFEKVYERVLDNVNKSGGLKKLIFYWAKRIAEEVARKQDKNEKISRFLQIKYNLADKLVFKAIREKTGGRIVFAVSGSSPLARHIAYFFYGAKIPVLEGYGLTEASPIVSTNTLERNKIGTVGTPFKSVEIKKGEDSELLVRGPNVMLGYYKDEESTKEVITEDGWLKTGDICEIDSENFIKIIDRKKDMYKTSGGKYIIPQKIENMARAEPYISEFVVIAENKKYASAILLPNFDKLREFANENNIEYNSEEDLINNKIIQEFYQKIIDENLNSKLARYETIKKFIMISKPFTIENGQLTPSLKVKRKIVNQQYEDKISKLYNE
ncbi:MAG: AMP-dependent synthetase/ligase [Spirochaetota bacterium]